MSRRKIPTSPGIDDITAELSHAGDRADLVSRIDRLWRILEKNGLDATDRKLVDIGRGEKKNFAQRFSEALAQKVANALRSDFPGIQPDADGQGHESLSTVAHGLKKIDVNYSTKRSGLELAISIKTMNFKDGRSGRYTKNTRRVDSELRAEAEDCHKRQPFAVLVVYYFLPLDAASDGKKKKSSLRHTADVLKSRSGRKDTKNENSLFELAFIGLYDDEGAVSFYSPEDVPDDGIPEKAMTFTTTLDRVRKIHMERNIRR